MKMNVKGNDNFRTPQGLYEQLDRIFNFTLDAACTKEDCKAPRGLYHDEGVDALEISWGGGTGFPQSALQPQSRIYCKGFLGSYARRLSDRRHGASVKLPRQQSVSTIHQKAILFRDAFRTCCFYRSGNKAAYEGQ